MKKILLASFLIFSFFTAFGQELNKYQYVLIPSKMAFQKVPNQYNLNVLIKLHLNKLGFKAFLDNEEIPADMKLQCARLTVDVEERSTLFVTELQIRLKDCLGEVLYTSETGSSRIKDYNGATRQATARAFENFQEQTQYAYNGQNGDVERIREQMVGKANVATTDDMEQVHDQHSPKATTNDEVRTPVVLDTNTVNPANAESKTNDSKTTRDWWVMNAKSTANGYELTESKGSKKVSLRQTSVKDVYIATFGEHSGTFHQVDGQWILEYYVGDVLQEVLIVVHLDK